MILPCGLPLICQKGRWSDRRESWEKHWRQIAPDRYVRRRPKKARHWPHKKNDPPCGMPQVRMAQPHEIRRAKRRLQNKQTA